MTNLSFVEITAPRPQDLNGNTVALAIFVRRKGTSSKEYNINPRQYQALMSAAAEVEPNADDFGLLLWPKKATTGVDELQEAYFDGFDDGYNAACCDRSRLF